MQRGSASPVDSYPMDKLYAQLSEQHSILQQRTDAQKAAKDATMYSRGFDNQASCNSLPLTPAVESFSAPGMSGTRSASATPTDNQAATEELLRLKIELAQAQTKISQMDQELAQNRAKTTGEFANPGLAPERDYAPTMRSSGSPVGTPSDVAHNPSSKMPSFSREGSWMTQDDTPSNISDSLPVAVMNRPRGIWNNGNGNIKSEPNDSYFQGQMMMDGTQSAPWSGQRGPNYDSAFPPSGMDMYRQDRMVPDHDAMRPTGRRGSRYDNRYGSSNHLGGGFNGYNMGPAPYDMAQGYSAGPQGMMGNGLGMASYSSYQQQQVGTSLSPHATEFTSSTGPSWKGEVS